MTIAFSTLITGFEEFIEALPVISDADAGSNATKIVDAALSIYGDGYFDGYWIYVTSGDAEGDIRQVETFVQVSGTLTPWVNFSAAVASSDDYELHKHNPDSVKRAINDALVSLYSMPPAPWLFRKIVFESLGLSLLTSNATSGQPDVIVADATLFFEGQGVTISDDDGSEQATISSINSGTNTLTMEANLTNAYDKDTKNAQVVADSGKYFNLGATIGNARITGVYSRADSVSIRKQYTNFNIIESLAGARQIYFPSSISVDDQTWIIEAIDKLEEVSTPASTITLEDRRVKLLYAMTAYHFYDRQANEISAGDFDRLVALALKYWNLTQTIYRHLRMALPVERVHLEYDSDSD